MTNYKDTIRTFYSSHREVLCGSEQLDLPALSGKIESLYAMTNQCRVTLAGQDGVSLDDPTLNRWVYRITMPVMLVAQNAARRAEIHLTASLFTPFTEEKMRYGCQLQCDCDVYPRHAAEISAGRYRITYDARIALYATLLRACASS